MMPEVPGVALLPESIVIDSAKSYLLVELGKCHMVVIGYHAVYGWDWLCWYSFFFSFW